MEYREYVPDATLEDVVHCIWTLRGAAGEAERIVPDGRPELVFNLADPFERRHADGSVERQPLALLVGQTLGPVHVQPTGTIDLIGLRFRPEGAAALLAVPLHEITGRIPALDDVEPGWQRVRERIGNAPPEARAATLFELIERRSARAPDARVAAATAAIGRSDGALRIDGLATRLGLGRRQLERLFLRDVGISPKLLARIHRFQAVLRAARAQRSPSWASLAARFGFADQSHMIREVRAFAGATPNTLVGQGGEAPPLFLEY